MSNLQRSELFLCLLLVASSLVSLVESSDDLAKCSKDGIKLNCSGAEFTQVVSDEDLQRDIEVLDLSHNLIHNVTEFVIPTAAATLTTLILSDNQVSIIKNNAFSLLTNLVHLDLSRNLIQGKELQEDMFYDLRKLKTLNLERNPLRVIKKNTLNFIQLPALEYLDLSHCEIAVLEERSIELPSLEILNLSWNMLETIDEGAFRLATSLHHLDMSHNNIRVLDGELPSFPEIKTWILDNNFIGKLKLRDEIWNNADSLQKLSLRNNDILVFDKDSLPLDLDTLTDLDLTNNPIQCDCKMTWIKFEKIYTEGRTITIPCKYPTELQGRNLMDVAADDLTCKTSLVHWLLLALFIVVIVLSTVLMFYFLCRKRCRRKTKKPDRGDTGGDYTAVYTRDEDDVRVELSDNKNLINENREFDV